MIEKFRGLMVASLLALAPLVAVAAEPPGGGIEGDHGGPHPWGPMGPHPGEGHGGGWGPGWRLEPRFLRGLELTDEQRDKIFAIEHAAEPALREQVKALRKAREALRDAAARDAYNEAEVRTSTEAAGRAMSQLALLRIRGEHDIYALLTPAQRAEIASRRERWKAHGVQGEGGMHGSGGMRGDVGIRDGMPSHGPGARPAGE
jgi:Spy/CpxP family protein refolding chaperone